MCQIYSSVFHPANSVCYFFCIYVTFSFVSVDFLSLVYTMGLDLKASVFPPKRTKILNDGQFSKGVCQNEDKII